MNNLDKIILTIGYIFFALMSIIALTRGRRSPYVPPRSPAEYYNDMAIDYAVLYSCSIWIAWQAIAEINNVWN